MAAEVPSHPLRLTARDEMNECNADAWWGSYRDFDLHVRVICARELHPGRSGLPDTYAKLHWGSTGSRQRTATCRRHEGDHPAPPLRCGALADAVYWVF